MKSLKSTLAIFFFFCLAASTVQAQGVNFFHGSFAEAKAKAADEGKLVFMDAYTTWCAPCKWMNANVFPNEDVAAYFNKHFVSMKVDMEKGEGPELARRYRVVAYPSLFFISPDGNVVRREIGMKKAGELLDIARAVEAKR